jgi:adenosylcobinamide-phosphate synthase
VNPVDPAVLTLAIVLDLLLGDPRWLPHPVVFIGNLITIFETFLRKTCSYERIAGVFLLIATVSVSTTITWLLLRIGSLLHPLAGLLVATVISYTCLAARSLHNESALVADALAAGDLPKARIALSYIVGRDTAHLDEPGIWRAVVETVAENTSDGIIAPLFWMTAGGPLAAVAYKAVSTLDSMVGYKNERYLHFGWASARMDDLLNFIPARLTALLMVLASALAGLSPQNAIRITLRDRLNHPSPNSGHPEAAAAGALRVQLGGKAFYGGRESWKQFIGDPLVPLDEQTYRGMLKLMYISTIIMAALCIAVAMALKGFHVTLL